MNHSEIPHSMNRTPQLKLAAFVSSDLGLLRPASIGALFPRDRVKVSNNGTVMVRYPATGKTSNQFN
jgi:hypothetical protein